VLDVSNRRRELERSGAVEYMNGGFVGRLWAQRFDRLDEVTVDAYQRLPELDLSYDAYFGGLDWSLAGSAVAFDRDNEQLTGVSRINGQRLHLEPKVRLPLSRSWGYLTVTGGYRYTTYNLEDTAADVDDQPQRGIGLGSIDSGLFFDRDTRMFGAGVVQTLEPRIYYLYQQFEDQDQLPRFDATQLTFRYDQLWRDNRFSGVDRIGDANQLSVGLTSRFLNATTGREYFRASLGQIRYFEDRRVTLSGIQSERDLSTKSEVAGDMVASAGRFSLGATLVWDPEESAVNDGGGYLRYRGDNDHILHLGYRYLRASRIDQTDVGFTWPVSRRYGLIGRWNYDLKSKRTIEGLAGIEYNDCCWKIRLIARHYLDAPSASALAEADTRQGYYLQVVFKGLAGIGNSVESMLSNSLPGYLEEN